MTGPTKGLMKATGAGAGGERLLEVDMENEVRLAYDTVKTIDVLDVSVGGTEAFLTAETAYNERVARVENQIIARLRDRLGTARNANEMFRVFSKFNTLLVRQKVRADAPLVAALAVAGPLLTPRSPVPPRRSAARSRSTRRS